MKYLKNDRNEIEWEIYVRRFLLRPFLRSSITKNVFQELLRHEEVVNKVDLKKISSYALQKGKDDKCLVKHRRTLYHICSLLKSFSARNISHTRHDEVNLEQVNEDEMEDIE